MKNVDVSVVVINYNTFDLTCHCIDSILNHSQAVAIEIILVDNASTDRDPEDFKSRYPAIVLVKSSENTGFSKGNNLGIKKAIGTYILLVNSDAQLVNNVCLVLREFLLAHDRIAAVTARLEYPDGTVQHNCQRFPSIGYKLFELLRIQKLVPRGIAGRILLGPFFDYNSVVFPDWIWGTCFMFKKELLERLPSRKLADEFFMYGEDVQWCLEFKKLGYRVAFTPSAKLIHYVGKSGGKSSEHVEENMRLLLARYYSPLHRKLISFIDKCLHASIRSY